MVLIACRQIVESTHAVYYAALGLRHFGGACTELNVPIERKYCAVHGYVKLPRRVVYEPLSVS